LFFDLQAQDATMSGMAVLMVAIGGASLICYLLMNQAQNRNARREGVSDSGPYGSSDSSSTDGWSLFSWGGSDSSSSHDSASSSDSGGDTGGGAGDGGGGSD
jgi:hypothetical protein